MWAQRLGLVGFGIAVGAAAVLVVGASTGGDEGPEPTTPAPTSPAPPVTSAAPAVAPTTAQNVQIVVDCDQMLERYDQTKEAEDNLYDLRYRAWSNNGRGGSAPTPNYDELRRMADAMSTAGCPYVPIVP